MEPVSSKTLDNCWHFANPAKLAGLPGHVLLDGRPGLGKTRLADDLAKALNLPAYHLTLNQMSVPSDILWSGWAKAGTAEVQLRPGILAWTTPGILCLHEINEASMEVQMALHAVLDDPDIAGLTLPNGSQVKPLPGFRCVATMNGTAEDLESALLDRFSIRIHIDHPSPQQLATLSEDLRVPTLKAYTQCTPEEQPFHFREVRAYDQYRQYVPEEEAARLIWQTRSNKILGLLKLSS